MSTNTDYLSAGQEMACRHSTEHASFAQQQEDLRHSRLVNASMSRAGINPEEAAVLRGQRPPPMSVQVAKEYNR